MPGSLPICYINVRTGLALVHEKTNMNNVLNGNSSNLFARIEGLKKQLETSLQEVDGLKESRERQVHMVSNLV